MKNKISQLSIPYACNGCNNISEPGPSVTQRVEAVTGIKVWSETNYAGDRLPVLEDAFRGKIAESVVAVAVREQQEDLKRFNEVLSTCPGLQTGQVCGRIALNTASNAIDQ